MFVEQSVSLSVRPSVSPPLQPPSSMSGRPSKLVLGQFCSGEITRRSAWPLLYTGVMVYIIATGVTLYYYGKTSHLSDFIMGTSNNRQTILWGKPTTVRLYYYPLMQLSHFMVLLFISFHGLKFRQCYGAITLMSDYVTVKSHNFQAMKPHNCHTIILSSHKTVMP